VAESTNDAMRRFSILVGEWTTESTHPALPDTVVHGRATFEWLAGERFLIWREHADHPEFPDAIVIIGDPDGLHAHSFDSRGSYRVVETRISDETWEYLMPREQPSDTAFAEGSSGFSDGSSGPSRTAATPSPAGSSCRMTTRTGRTTCRPPTGACPYLRTSARAQLMKSRTAALYWSAYEV
jgi:hypothetical protein